MIVPKFWAEARLQHIDEQARKARRKGGQITLRRFGWSDESQEAAQAHAELRAREAMARVLAGEELSRREPKRPYNGADGVPIREEIVETRSETVVTRNSYGARCLNTPNVLFVDMDFPKGWSLPTRALFIVSFIVLFGLSWRIDDRGVLAVMDRMFGAFIVAGITEIVIDTLASWLFRLVQTIQGGAQRVALRKVRRFVQANPDWNLRVYRTPLGLRVLATHRPFLPSDPQVAHCFSALGADPMYRKMCLLQQCFRARVSAKPWRIGVKTRMKPRPGLWPVRPERLAERAAWIEKYETVAKRFAACHFIEQYGSGQEHADVEPVRVWHDELCRALEARLPLA